ncbi:MAG: 3-deoxy-manno-octulosonate cytidylyltransferase [Alphaproteobacteria bacterium]|nr:MAG: 3-deoxy-manno-octulosonate cytidylyltransferase [Alphaproteobacteria bacterium]
MNPIVVIPARLASSRLPRKPLADIHGEPMVVHVWRRALAAAVGPVVVACGDAEIVAAITQVRGNAVLTDPNLPSGSDRVMAAMRQLDPDGDFDVVVNLQGDFPTIDPQVLRQVLTPLADPEVDIATLAVELHDPRSIADPNAPKIALERHGNGNGSTGRCLYFSRLPLHAGDGNVYEHLGIYAFRRRALEAFVALPQAGLEQVERLEQLRALAAGMRIDATIVHTFPLGVDTPADLEKARTLTVRPN